MPLSACQLSERHTVMHRPEEVKFWTQEKVLFGSLQITHNSSSLAYYTVIKTGGF
jgi:hypothetical protein